MERNHGFKQHLTAHGTLLKLLNGVGHLRLGATFSTFEYIVKPRWRSIRGPASSAAMQRESMI
jgi:hypothetical protein